MKGRSALTHVERTYGHLAMRALVLRLLPSLSWRHHGIGVIQGYVFEDVEPEIRVHVRHRDLVKRGMAESGDIHDHRFDLVSHVLAGAVGHEECVAEPDPEGEWTTMRLTHARAAADSKFHGPTESTGDRFRVRRNLMVIEAGHSYSFPSGHFHRSPLTGVAVTCVEKHAQKPISARLLHPIAKPPVMAFGHEIDAALVMRVLREATVALTRER